MANRGAHVYNNSAVARSLVQSGGIPPRKILEVRLDSGTI